MSISRLKPPADDGHANMAACILQLAVYELDDDSRKLWVDSVNCRFWCALYGVPHFVFASQAAHFVSKEPLDLDDVE